MGFKGATSNAKQTSDGIELTPDVSTVDGDVMLAIVSVRGPNLTANAITPPAEWTQVDALFESGSPSLNVAVFLRVASGEGAAHVFTFVTSNESAGSLLTYDGVDTSAPVLVSAIGGQDASSTTRITPEINVTAPGCWIVSYFADRSGSEWVGPDVERSEVKTLPGPSTSHVVCDSGAAVSTGVTSRTATATVATSVAVQGILALRPVPTGGAGTGTATVSVTASGTGTKGATGTATAPVAVATASAGAKGAAGVGAVEVTVSASGSGSRPAPPAPPAFPDAPLDVLVELQIGHVWEDITDDVYMRDEIHIRRGRADEGARADAAEVSLTLNNRSGKYSARNPHSPLYGLIGRNTPLRITTRGEGWESVRVVAEVASWPPRWDVSGEDRYVPITASGVLRRLGQGAKPLRSALTRSVLGAAPYTAWWPLEDGPGAVRAASGYAGRVPARLVGDAQMTDTPAGGVAGGVEISETGRVIGGVTGGTADWVIACWMDVPANIGDEDITPFVQWTTPGALRGVAWDMATAGGLGGRLLLEVSDSSNQIIWSTLGSIDLRGRGPVQVLVSGYQDGGIVQVRAYVNGELDIIAGTGADQAAPVQMLGLNASTDSTSGTRYTGTVSHLMVAPYTRLASVLSHVPAGGGYVGEPAADRITRLCAEEGIYVTVIGDPAESAPLGPQQPLAPLDLLDECAHADGGTLGEHREALGLQYRIRSADYNSSAALVLDYAAGDIAPPLEPVEDDQRVRNDVTATRSGGSFAQVVIEAGPLSIKAPPSGVGRYDEGVTVNVATDEQLLDVAGWRAHLGTWDEARFPTVALDLAAAPHLIPDVIEVDARTHVQLVRLPDEVPPGPVELLVDGYAETIGDFDWDITLNASPAGPWTVGVVEDEVLGHVDTDGSELAAAVGADDTTWSVATTDGPIWTTDPADLPFDLSVGGEVVTVTAITGTTSPQTFTVQRAVNGVRKPHGAGADVRLANPAIIAR